MVKSTLLSGERKAQVGEFNLSDFLFATQRDEVKKVISISLGSSKRDQCVEVDLLGQTVQLERRGVDGDIAKATALFETLDGEVDAFGVGGIDLWIQLEKKRYNLTAAQKMVKNVRQTPVVDGTGLKHTLERHVVHALIEQLGNRYASGRVLLPSAVDRFGMAQAFEAQSYEIVFGDLMFVLGLPIAIRSFKTFEHFAAVLAPIVTKLPISMLYPTGSAQEVVVPKFEKWYAWASVIAGDCHFIKRHMPDDLSGKVIVTNTTTENDMAQFRKRGVSHVLTTTPVINGRSFGTNLLEAALTAVAGKNRPLTFAELDELIGELGLSPMVHWL